MSGKPVRRFAARCRSDDTIQTRRPSDPPSDRRGMECGQDIWVLCGLCRLHAPRPRQRLHADLRLHHNRRAGRLHQSVRSGGDVKLDLITKKQDEFYTPRYAIVPILKYVPSGSRVLCPFDTSDSNFVKMLRGHGCTVTHSHIVDGLDFWKMSGAGFDFVISNPPYSCKGDVLQRLFEWDIPFVNADWCCWIV